MKLLSLTKPGIIFGNIITALGGFLLAQTGNFNLTLLLATLTGLSLIIACGCVTNNYIDRDIDQLMERTKNRPTALGLIPLRVIVYYALTLGISGAFILFMFTNLLTFTIALIGLFFYVVVYTLWLKRASIYGTLIGGISGAVPPVVGYCAVTNQVDMGALLLFLLLFTWQIPHSYAIAIYRLADYTRARIPVSPVVKGIPFTKASMLLYLVAFALTSLAFFFFGYTGFVYLVVASVINVMWLYLSAQGFYTKNDAVWAKKMFLFSIITITVLCLVMGVKL